MADPTYLSGKVGYVLIADTDNGPTEYHFGEWSMPLHAEFIKRNTFLSEGFQNGVSGFKSSKFTCRGPYATDQFEITVGGTYEFYLGLTEDGPYEFRITGHLSDMNISNNAEGAPELELSCDSIGSFDVVTV